MKICVIGATGQTGKEITKQLLEAGHEVKTLVRDPSRLEVTHNQLSFITGNVLDGDSVSDAVAGSDAVIVALGAGRSLAKTNIRAEGTLSVITAMITHKIQRLIVISAMGTGESWKDMGLINRLFYATLLKHSRRDHEAQEAHVRSTTLDWTIIRPSGLTDAPGTGNYLLGESLRAKKSQIPRADVAHCVLRTLQDSTFIHKGVTVSN